MTKKITPPTAKERNYWFDNTKAFLIICVVVGHLANGTFSTSTDWVLALQRFIYIFHMPAFMIVSGRFAKKRVDNGDWVTVISKMIVPYIIFQTFFLVLYSALGAKPKTFSYFNPLFGLWYFISVAVYAIITTHLKKFKLLFPASIALALLSGFFLGTLYGGFQRLVNFYPFFLFGYFTATANFDFCKKPWFRVMSYVAFFALGIYMLHNHQNHSWRLLCLNCNYETVLAQMLKSGVNWTMLDAFLHCVLRYVAGFLTFFVILGMMPVKKRFFSYVGTYSVYVYVLHCILIVMLREIDADYDILGVLTNKWTLLAYCFSGIPLSFLLASEPVRRWTRFFVEPKFDLGKIVKKLAGTEREQQ